MSAIALGPILVKAMLQFRSWTSRSHQFSSHKFVIPDAVFFHLNSWSYLWILSKYVRLVGRVVRKLSVQQLRYLVKGHCMFFHLPLVATILHPGMLMEFHLTRVECCRGTHLSPPLFLGVVSCDLPNKPYSAAKRLPSQVVRVEFIMVGRSPKPSVFWDWHCQSHRTMLWIWMMLWS